MIKKYYWIIFLAMATITVMYLYGMTGVYLSEPYDIGFGQFLDIKSGVVFVSLLLLGFIIGFFTFKKNKKK